MHKDFPGYLKQFFRKYKTKENKMMTVFFGFSADHKVYALNLETGAEKWTCYTQGPEGFGQRIIKHQSQRDNEHRVNPR